MAEPEFRLVSSALLVAILGDIVISSWPYLELKIDVGPGYRVYYTQRKDVLIILLCGGDKSSQAKDIKLAYELVQGLEV